MTTSLPEIAGVDRQQAETMLAGHARCLAEVVQAAAPWLAAPAGGAG